MYLCIKTNLHDAIPDILSEVIFSKPPDADDHLPQTLKQLTTKFSDVTYHLSLNEIQILINTMNTANDSELKICVYRDYLLSSMNPSAPSDASKSERDNDFIRPDIHPCSVCHTCLNESHVVGGENFDNTYNEAQNCDWTRI